MMNNNDEKTDNPDVIVRPSLAEAFIVWLKIGLLGFGGPVGQIALMHRMLVEEKKWIGESRFMHALNFCMVLPGPEAQQLATYVGWLLHRTLGGVMAGMLFVLPGAVVMLLLSIFYVQYADLSIVQSAFFGVKTAIIAVVTAAVMRIGKKALKDTFARWTACIAFVAIFFASVPFPAIVVAAALAGFWHARVKGARFGNAITQPEPVTHLGVDNITMLKSGLIAATVCLLLWVIPVVLLYAMLGPDNIFTGAATFFSKMAVITFGGAYAVLSYVAQEAVTTYGWMTPTEMVDGLGLAKTTPGPLIMVVQFVGFLAAYRADTGLDPMLAGVLGAVVVAWVTFAPCFLWIFLGAPFVEKLRGATALNAAFFAVTAAMVGVILNLAVWFAVHVLFQRVSDVTWGPIKTIMPVWSSVDLTAVGLSLFSLVLVIGLHVRIHIALLLAACIGGVLALL